MADTDCLGLADERQCEDDGHPELPNGQNATERHNERPSVDNRGSQPEFTEPSGQSFSTEASTTATTTTTTTYTSPSSSSSPSLSLLLPDSSNKQTERNSLTTRPADYDDDSSCGLTHEPENNDTDTKKKPQVWENDIDKSKNQLKNNSNKSSYNNKEAKTTMQNGDPKKTRVTTTTSNNNNTPTAIPSSSSSHQQMTTMMNGREYAQVVRAWLWQYHQWNSMCAFGMMLPYYAMATLPYYAAQNNYPHSSTPGARPSVVNNGGAASPGGAAAGGAGGNNNMNNPGGAAGGPADGGRANQSPQTPQTPQQNFRATEYMIPSLWKRILAELVDFVLLFYIKLMVSVMVMKHMGYIDLEKYDLEYNWFVTMDEFDLSKVFHFTSEVILFELLNRISITIVETMCLRRGIGVVGGATPGKRLLGMKVVSCTDILDLGNGRIQVTPARDIGLYSALLRSILKNFTIAFFFPACLTVFFFDHNRAAYDVLAGSIVVQPVEEAGEL